MQHIRDFFDIKISMSTVIWLITLFVGLGALLQRFDHVSDTVTEIVVEEENKAEKAEVIFLEETLAEEISLVEQRLNKKIQIINEHDDLIHDLYTEIARLQTRMELLHDGEGG